MKIFNWMHRKFHLKDEYGRNIPKKDNEGVGNKEGEDTEGLLAIGTLGGFGDMLKRFVVDHHHEDVYHRFQFSDENDNGEEYEEEDDDDDDGDEYGWHHYHNKEELDPLVTPPSPDDDDGDKIIVAQEEDTTRNKVIVINSEGLNCCDENKRRKRITLADLFSADEYPRGTEEGEEKENGQVKNPSRSTNCDDDDDDDDDDSDDDEKATTKYKMANGCAQGKHGGLSFAKKLIPWVSDESRPIHKFHQLLTRMVKRKIHPDMVEVNYKKRPTSMLSLLSSDTNKHADSVSLLLETTTTTTQDVNITTSCK